MPIAGGVFLAFGWFYVFSLVLIHYDLTGKHDGSFDALLETVALFVRPSSILCGVVGSVCAYMFGSWFFGWVIGMHV